MTVSILDTLATLPSGLVGAKLSFAELGGYLRTHCDTQAEKDRNKRHALRDEIYRDGGVEFLKSVLDDVFEDRFIAEKRKKWVQWARYSNPLKRVVNELSTVYADPAKRIVEGEENDKKYQAVLEAVCMDEQMLQISRLLNLHRAILVRCRVRQLPDDTREPVIDWATPAHARAVLHPNDPTLVVGWLIRTSMRPARDQVNVPSWVLWTDHERLQLREDMSPIVESYLEHGLGRNPWVAVTVNPPGPGFWPGEEGEDLVAAAVAMWVQSLLMLKESKSATNIPVIQGDGTMTARGQAADSESPIELADGQSVTTVDMSMDLGMWQQASDHILGHVAQNYGMSAALVNNQGVQSAEAREALRIPLRELRKHQQVPLRRLERSLATVMVAVLKSDLPEMAFSVDGWRIEFGEAQTPLSRREEIDVFTKARGAALDNTVAFIQRQRPGMTWEQATEEMVKNIEVETHRNELMRPLMMVSGALGAETPDPAVDESQDSNVLGQDSTGPESSAKGKA